MDDDRAAGLTQASNLNAVIGDAPAAILVVDLGSGSVVHANSVAEELAPGLNLPVGLETWSDAAALRDPAGAELSETDHPLTRLLRAEEVPGQRVSARRRSAMGEAREPLWVVGLPMTGAPMLDDHALVVLLSVREHDATAAVEAFADQDAQIRDRAVLATGLSFTVADARDPDMALIWVNPAFTAATGYSFEDAVGHNCRFLQGPATDRDEVKKIRRALEDREAISTTLLNYRKDGLAFWNHVTMTPIHDGDGEVTHFVGVQTDVSGRVESDRQRDAALTAEHEARTRAEVAQSRLQLMAGASESLAGELDVVEARARLLQLLVPSLADMALFFHVNEAGAVTEHLTLDRDPSLAGTAEHYAALVPAHATREGLITTLLEGQDYRLLDDVDSDESLALRKRLLDDEQFARESVDDLGVVSVLAVGLPGRRGVRDVVILNRRADRPPFGPDDADVAVDLGRRAGLILDNVRMYSTQSKIAQTLQRSLISELPDLPGVTVEAQYLAGADGAEVGGDFYDVIELVPLAPHAQGRVALAARDLARKVATKVAGAAVRITGSGQDPARRSPQADTSPGQLSPGRLSRDRRPFALVVGDVSGHDVYAAAAMGQLKGLVQATATLQQLMPAAVLEHIDRLLPALNNDPTVATMAFLHFQPLDTGDWVMTLSNAGHPPPLLHLPDGRVEFVDPDGARGQLLGLGPCERGEVSHLVPAGSTLMAYTDGLIERRGESIDVGMNRLRLAADLALRSPGRVTDSLISALGAGQIPEDDVVLVAVRFD